MKLNNSIIIGLVAGEASGDIIGAGLIRELKKYLPKAIFVGIAGPCMRAEGMNAWYCIEELSIMGFIEVIKKLPNLLRIRYNLIQRLIDIRPDVFIGIDAPDFNITIENQLKRFGISTIHYISPSVWAWRQKRIFKLKQATNNILISLPFEKKIFDRFNIPCQFIGHTIADMIPLNPNKIAARRYLGISTSAKCLAILPGSRKSEIEMLSAVFLHTAELLNKQFPLIEIIIPLINANIRTQFENIKAKVAPKLIVHLLNQQSHQAMISADVALLASGTATLECMLAKCPMVVGYRMKPLNFAFAKKFVKTPWISLPNILSGSELVTELLQENCCPNMIMNALIPLLECNDKRAALITKFYQLHSQIRCNANKLAANAVLALIKR